MILKMAVTKCGQSPASQSGGPGFDIRPVQFIFVVFEVTLGHVFISGTSVSHASIIPSVPNIYLYLHVAVRRTSGRRL